MITGECPYCDGTIVNEMPERSPAYSIQTCPSCKKQYWMVHSRIQSVAWKKEAFEAAHDIDLVNKTITPKAKP